MPDANRHVVAAILVADLKGSSDLTGQERDLLLPIYKEQAENLLNQNHYRDYHLKSETAGDGLHIIFSGAVAAGNYALDLLDIMETTDWKSRGITRYAGIRIAIHCGIVCRQYDHPTGTYAYTGHAHDLVTRMEPVTAVNEVFASQAYAAQCMVQDSCNLYFTPVGHRELKKTAGDVEEMPFFRLGRCGGWRQDGRREWLASARQAPFGSDADWLWLKSLLAKGRVVPVIGPELMRIKIRDEFGAVREANLYNYAVKQLALELGVSHSEDMTFADIFDLCIKSSRPRMEIRFRQILEDLTDKCEPPEALRKLVGLRCFPGYLVTTPDAFLKKAVEREYGQSWQGDWSLYGDKEPQFRGDKAYDIEPELATPFIFHVFGKLNQLSQFYALTENDMLMFSRSWNHNGPAKLKTFLQGREKDDRKVILMLGCNYENWYARLFLFNLSAETTCSTLNDDVGIVADEVSRNDLAFGYFLARDKYGKIYYDGNAEKFIDAMVEKLGGEIQAEEERRPVNGVVVVGAGTGQAAVANALYEQVKKAGFNCKLLGEAEFGNTARVRIVMSHTAVFIPVVAGESGRLDDILPIGLKENEQRRSQTGKDYFMMPLFLKNDVLPPTLEGVPPENRLSLSGKAEAPLTDDGIDQLYRNLCIHEDK